MRDASTLLEDRVTIATPEGVDLDVVVAGIGSRFVARFIDTLVQGGAIFALLIVLGVFSHDGLTGVALAVVFIAAFAILLVYDALFEQLMRGRTPGKAALGLRVVDDDGSPVSIASSVLRNVVRVVDFLPALYIIGLVTMLATAHSQRLGDVAAGTLVIRERFAGKRMSELEARMATSVAPEAVAMWDVSAVSADEMLVVRRFLERRLALPDDVRYRAGVDLASRLAAKVTGLPPTSHPEYVLEGVVVAKDTRA